jgi:hypothetical protein
LFFFSFLYRAKQLIAAGAPSNVVLNVLHRGKNRIYTVRRDRYVPSQPRTHTDAFCANRIV